VLSVRASDTIHKPERADISRMELSLTTRKVSDPADSFGGMNSLIEQDESGSPLSVDDLGDRIVAAAGRIAAATSQWLLLVAEFDRREGYARYGLASTAQWLGWACELSHRTAVEHVRVARGLAAHPRLAAEMAEGRLSFSHVRAITRVAEPGTDELVDSLIMAAQHGTVRHVETLVQGLRIVEAATLEQPAPADYLRHSWTSVGQLQPSARLDPEAGAVVTAALDAIASAEDLSPAQALALMAEIALAAINDRATPPRTLRGEERAAIVIHIDESRLAEDDTDHRIEDAAARSHERVRAIGRIAEGPGLPRRSSNACCAAAGSAPPSPQQTPPGDAPCSTWDAPTASSPNANHSPAATRPRLRPPRLTPPPRPASTPRHPLDPRRPHRPGQDGSCLNYPLRLGAGQAVSDRSVSEFSPMGKGGYGAIERSSVDGGPPCRLRM
jgi:hypothetical protein